MTRPAPDADMWLIKLGAAVLILLAAGAAGAWFHSGSELDDAIARANARSSATSAEAVRRSAAMRSLEASERQASLRMQLEQQQAEYVQNVGTGSSIDGRAIHRCVIYGTVVLQMKPCENPGDELPPERSSRYEDVQVQVQMRAQAEAKLRREMARFNAAAGTNSPASQPWYPSQEPFDGARARCQQAKAERDEAYRVAGNNRSFEMIRRWNDIVYEACKGS